MNRDLGVWASEDCALALIAGLDEGVTLIGTGTSTAQARTSSHSSARVDANACTRRLGQGGSN
jgi:hypothetical protein